MHRAPVSGAKKCRWNLWEVDHQLRQLADQYCSQPRNFLSIAFNNGLGPDVLKVANRVHLASSPIDTGQRTIRKLARNAIPV
jgi:hypothetical protein